MLIALAMSTLIAGTVPAGDPEGVVTTAPQGSDSVLVGAVAPMADAVPEAVGATVTQENLTTRQQIDRWIGARSAAQPSFAEAPGPVDDRKMHGFVSGSIGTQDFSNVTVGVSLPVGETGRLDLSFSQTRNGYGLGSPYGGYDYEGYPLAEHSYPLDSAFPYGGLIYPGYGLGYGYGRGGGYATSGNSRSFSLSYQSGQDRDRTPVLER
jgi:hypothetical protein